MHKWQTHINNICRTVSRNIYLLSKLSQIVSHKAKLGFFFAHIMSHIKYVSNAWDRCAYVHMKQQHSFPEFACCDVLDSNSFVFCCCS